MFFIRGPLAPLKSAHFGWIDFGGLRWIFALPVLPFFPPLKQGILSLLPFSLLSLSIHPLPHNKQTVNVPVTEWLRELVHILFLHVIL